MNEIKYTFKSISTCDMCGSDTSHHRILGKRLNQSQGKNPQKKTGLSTIIMRCNDCDLIFSNPQPIPENIQDHYGIPPENYWNEQYISSDTNYFSNEISTLKKLMPIQKGLKALDIGAGLGKCMIALEKVGFDAYGLEPSEPFYKKALEKKEINPEKLKLGMIEEVEYSEDEFDFITFGAVLEHLYSPSESIEKAMKWLKPNGIMHIEVPSSNWLISSFINRYYKLKGLDYVGNISPMHAPFHLYEFGLKSFEAHGKKNNYEIALSEYHVCTTYMPKIIDFFIIPYMKWTSKGMQLSVWLKKKK
jgi:2-polyprenyl-3-methyl-5-hydroxy-6-metoxy-1,4-benzoquinol methylase